MLYLIDSKSIKCARLCLARVAVAMRWEMDRERFSDFH
jgi:hypothetical protein